MIDESGKDATNPFDKFNELGRYKTKAPLLREITNEELAEGIVKIVKSNPQLVKIYRDGWPQVQITNSAPYWANAFQIDRMHNDQCKALSHTHFNDEIDIIATVYLEIQDDSKREVK